ncbi:MAG: hypothetical protein QW478_08850 [Candidatus Micrarchaeaceae archaeon]
MDFANAERIINASILTSKPPLMIMGENSIGKTEMLKAISTKFKHAQFTTSVEYGGLKQYIPLLQQHKTTTLVVSDLQRIILRRTGVRDNTIGLLSSLISEGTQFELNYNKDATDFSKRKKNYNLNVIIGCTPMHIAKLSMLGYYDFLVRFAYIPVERDTSKIDFRKEFKIEVPLYTTFDKARFKEIQEQDSTARYEGLSSRENMLLKSIKNGLKLINAKVDGQVLFYRPPTQPMLAQGRFEFAPVNL